MFEPRETPRETDAMIEPSKDVVEADVIEESIYMSRTEKAPFRLCYDGRQERQEQYSYGNPYIEARPMPRLPFVMGVFATHNR